MRCEHCGTVISPAARFCSNCGHPLPIAGEEANRWAPADNPDAMRSGQAAADSGPPQHTPWRGPSPARGIVWSLLLSPLAGAVVWSRDWRRLGNMRLATGTLASGLAVTVVAGLVMFFHWSRASSIAALFLCWAWVAGAYSLWLRIQPRRAASTLTRIAIGLLAIIELVGIVDSGGTPHQGKGVPLAKGRTPVYGRQQGPTVAAAVPVVALTTQASPANDYTIGVPMGWSVEPVQGLADGMILKPPDGPSGTNILVLPGIDVSDLRFTALLEQCTQAAVSNPITGPDEVTCAVQAGNAQLADSNHPWSPQETAQALIQVLNQTGQYGAPQLTLIDPHTAAFRVTATVQGQAFVSWGFLAVEPLENPWLSTRQGPGFTSIALLGSCSAPPGDASHFALICSQVLGSFHPRAALWQRIADQLANQFQQEANILLAMGQQTVNVANQRQQMIQQWGSAMLQMQIQTNAAEQHAQMKMAENEIATLGGDNLEKDPTTGKIYSLPFGYDRYCINATGDTAIMGNLLDVKPGVDGCTTILHPWQ